MEIIKQITRWIVGLVLFLLLMAAVGFISGPAKANILDTLKGHVDDIKSRFDNDRLQVDVDYIVKPSYINQGDTGQDFIHSSSGSVAIIRAYDGHYYLRLGSNFKSSPGPDYHVYLSYESEIIDELGFDETKQIEISKLNYGSGKQYYKLPTDIDVDKIKSFLLWCKKYGAYIGSASFE